MGPTDRGSIRGDQDTWREGCHQSCPHSKDGALDDEAKCLAVLAIDDIYIPVDFNNPAQADFDAFCTALERLNGKSIHVH